MARDGQSIRYSGAPKYNGLFGKPSYIEFSEIASATPIEWQVGDYVDYSRTGFRYKLYTIPQVVKSSTSGTAGDALAYLPEYGWERLGILLVGACRGIEPDVGRLKQVELYLGAEISLVANDAAVVVLQLDVV